MRQTTKKLIQELEGNELYFRDWGVVLVRYPHVFCRGEKKKLSSAEWEELVNGYFKDNSNEGYWLMKEAMEEFA